MWIFISIAVNVLSSECLRSCPRSYALSAQLANPMGMRLEDCPQLVHAFALPCCYCLCDPVQAL